MTFFIIYGLIKIFIFSCVFIYWFIFTYCIIYIIEL